MLAKGNKLSLKLSKQFKALICVRRLDKGGAEILECTLAEELNKLGVETHIAGQYSESDFDGKKTASYWMGRGIPKVYWLKAKKHYDIFCSFFRMASIVRKERFDVVITTNPGLDTIAGLSKFITYNFKHIVAFHEYPKVNYLKKYRNIIWRYVILRSPSRYYSISNYVKNEVNKRVGIPSEINKTIYNSIDFIRNDGPVNDRKKICDELNLPIDSKIIISVARIASNKGIDLALKYLGPKLEKWNAYILIIGDQNVGESTYYDKIIDIINQYNLNKRVKLLGFRNDVRCFMGSCDLLVHLARHEGFGLVLLEAMASKILLLSSDRGGIPEVLSKSPYTPFCLNDKIRIIEEAEKLLFLNQKDKNNLLEKACEFSLNFSKEERAKKILQWIRF